jgi:hypothetical protein
MVMVKDSLGENWARKWSQHWVKPDGIINVIKHNIIRISNGLILRIQKIKTRLAVIVSLNACHLFL